MHDPASELPRIVTLGRRVNTARRRAEAANSPSPFTFMEKDDLSCYGLS